MVAIALPTGLEGELTVLVKSVSYLNRGRNAISREGAMVHEEGDKRALYIYLDKSRCKVT